VALDAARHAELARQRPIPRPAAILHRLQHNGIITKTWPKGTKRKGDWR
jgi:hypothetical protein